jgi:hypothetical protein
MDAEIFNQIGSDIQSSYVAFGSILMFFTGCVAIITNTQWPGWSLFAIFTVLDFIFSTVGQAASGTNLSQIDASNMIISILMDYSVFVMSVVVGSGKQIIWKLIGFLLLLVSISLFAS